MGTISKLYSTLFQHSLKRTIYVVAGLIITLSLPITILLTQQQQDLRQRASFDPSSNNIGGTQSNCYTSARRGDGCSCFVDSQCASDNCSGQYSGQKTCKPKTTTPTTIPTPTQTPTTTTPNYSYPTFSFPTGGFGGYGNCSASTGRGTYCSCTSDSQCSSNSCVGYGGYSGYKICGPGGSSGTVIPSPTSSCGLNNRAAGCSCQLSTQCASGLTCLNNSCGGTNPLSPTPTNGPNETRILLSLSLPGISNRTSSSAAVPKRIARETKVEVYNSSNQKVSDKTGNLIYDTASKLYKGTISLGDGFTTGQYIVKVRMDNSLWKRIPGIVTITAKTDNNPTVQIQLVTGDLDQNNSLTVLDYTNFVKCFKGESTCSDSLKILADLDDDGSAKDDLDDLTILQKGFAVRDGD